jgi:hypothetical protein
MPTNNAPFRATSGAPPILVPGLVVGGQIRRLQAEAVPGPVNHGARGSHFSLPDRARGFDVQDDAMVGVDQIIGGVSEEGMTLVALRSTAPPDRRVR